MNDITPFEKGIQQAEARARMDEHVRGTVWSLIYQLKGAIRWDHLIDQVQENCGVLNITPFMEYLGTTNTIPLIIARGQGKYVLPVQALTHYQEMHSIMVKSSAAVGEFKARFSDNDSNFIKAFMTRREELIELMTARGAAEIFMLHWTTSRPDPDVLINEPHLFFVKIFMESVDYCKLLIKEGFDRSADGINGATVRTRARWAYESMNSPIDNWYNNLQRLAIDRRMQ